MKRQRFIILAATLLVLFFIMIVSLLSDQKKPAGNFSSELVAVDPEQVSTVSVAPAGGENPFELVKAEGEGWEVRSDGKGYLADSRSVDQLLGGIAGIKATQVVARSSDQWGEYSVSDSLGTRVSLSDDARQLASLVVGRITFSQSSNPYQQQPDAYSFVRMADDDAVYKVKGMLSMQVSGGVNGFRSGVVTGVPKADLQEVVFSYPADSAFVLTKRDSIWEIGGVQPDSASLASYLNTLSSFSSRSFADEALPAGAPAFSIQIKGADLEAVEVQAWSAEEQQYHVISSQNPGSVFLLKEAQFVRLFRGREWLLK